MANSSHSMFNIPGRCSLSIVYFSLRRFLINAFSEAAITSIERMHAMELLPQEKSMETSSEYKVDPSWPRKGVLKFSDVKMRYRPELPLALTGLSFSLEHGQRCAVVGRTGAGKSTITAALFRLVEIESGSISLDGVDLSQLGLADVRGRPGGMFILPQKSKTPFPVNFSMRTRW
jgi:ABC-type multidrug transport system fused ATPase/permease subunit